MFSCQPEEWLPFGDPITDLDPIAVEIQQRLTQDTTLPTPLIEIETSLPTIKHFLNNQSKNKESAYQEIVEWIQWRRGQVKFIPFIL
jgi:hypothetical protein